MNKNLLIRTAVAAVAIPIILWICYQGGVWLWSLVSLLFLIALSEFLVAEGYRSTSLAFVALLILGAIRMLGFAPSGFGALFDIPILGVVIQSVYSVPPLLLIFVAGGMLFAVGSQQPSELFRSFSRLLWGLFYLFELYPYVIEVGHNPTRIEGSLARGGDWLLFLFGLLWLGDTAAMFVGKAFGKHKLAPTVSPNKTVEGFVGGMVGAIVVAIILGFWRLDMIPMWQLIIIAIFCSIFGQLGDLVESMWKRSLGIKDSSALIPGHGGVLDRFDSLLFAAPVMYYAMILIGK